MFRVQGINHVGLTVQDIQRSVDWCQELLGLERLYEDVWEFSRAWLGLEIHPSHFSQPKEKSSYRSVFPFVISRSAWTVPISPLRN